MNETRDLRFDELLARVLDLPVSEQTAFIEANCDDPELRDELIRLLGKETALGEFLESPAGDALESSSDAGRPNLATLESSRKQERPEAIGPYRVQELLGEGGMGVVYLAEQHEPVKRELAIKVVRTDLSISGAHERFAAERQALARLSHPYIAQIYEAGTTDEGFPYFAMELVAGLPITRYCDENRLSVEERLRLFAKVCKGVQHAHQRGIIHRDLKPSNILVVDHDGAPVPKIIDFGIAKALDRPLTDVTQLTGLGAVGTPDFMSPESLGVGEEALDPDTRTDVYSLGVVLYELLAGSRPFGSSKGSVAQIVQRMLEEDVPRPSVRLSTLDDAEREEVARCRAVTAHALSRRLDGDLDWITVRAAAKDRDQRYTSAAELADDIERHLRHEPVSACPPSLEYQLGKLVRRHRAAAVAGVIAVLALTVGVIGLGIGLVRAKRAESKARVAQAEARSEADNAQQTLKLLEEFLSSAVPGKKGKDLMVRDLLEAFKPRLEELREEPGIQATLYHTYGRTYEALGLYEEAHSYLGQAYELRTEVLGGEHPDTLLSLNLLGNVRIRQGNYAEAEQLHTRSLDKHRRVFGEEHERTLSALNGLSIAVYSQGKVDQAEDLFRQCVDLKTHLLGEEHINTLNTMNNLANLLRQQGKYEESEELYRRSMETMSRVLGPEHPRTLMSMMGVALSLRSMGESAEAEEVNRACLAAQIRVLGEEHPYTLGTMTNLALSLQSQWKLEEALELQRRCLETQTRVLGEEHPDALASLNNVARTLGLRESYAESERLYRKSIEALERVLGETHPSTMIAMNGLANALGSQRRHSEAVQLKRRVYQTRKRSLGDEDRETLIAMSRLTETLAKAGRHGEAEAMAREALETQRRTLDSGDNHILLSMIRFAMALAPQGNSVEVSQLVDEIVNLADSRAIDVETVVSLDLLGDVLLRSGMVQEAAGCYGSAAGKGHPGARTAMNGSNL